MRNLIFVIVLLVSNVSANCQINYLEESKDDFASSMKLFADANNVGDENVGWKNDKPLNESIAGANTKKAKNPAGKKGFKTIFNGKNWDGWYLKIKSGDEAMAKKVFAIEDGMVHIFGDSFPDGHKLNTGENDTHGLFYTEKTYSKYILRFEYKWGNKKVNNFGQWQYDAGVYYHVTDDNIWPVGIEYQIRYNHKTSRNHTGDLIRPAGADYDWFCTEDGETFLHPNNGGKLEDKSKSGWMHLASPTKNFNAVNDKWNQCEIIVMGEEYAIHKLNGKVVNMAFNLKPGAGIFGFQAETAEIFYRNIQIKEFDEIVAAEEFIK